MRTQTAAPPPVRVEPPPRSPPPVVPAAAVALLDQCAAFVRQSGDDAYRAESRTLSGGTIGKHVRHVLDHFRALVDPPAAPGGTVDYDHRERNVPMETDRAAALRTIDGLRARLAGLGDADLARPIRVRVMVSGEGAEAVLDSTFGRELAFASHHAVHHHAMIKAIGAEHGIAAAPGFGLAPSTINFLAAHPPSR